MSIAKDREGFLWIASRRAVSKFDPKNENFILHLNDEMNLKEIWFCFFDNHDQLYVGGTGGLIKLDVKNIKVDSITPKMYLTSVRVNAVKLTNINNYKLYQNNRHYQFQFDHNENDISFEFDGIYFINPKKIRYQYKISSGNDNWNDLGTNRQINLNNLQPEKYEIKIRASNQDGVWSPEPIQLSLIITPPWWQTWWAYFLYALTIGIIGLAVFRFQKRRWELQSALQWEKDEAHRPQRT